MLKRAIDFLLNLWGYVMPGGRGEAETYCKLWVDIAKEIIEDMENPSDEMKAAVISGCMAIGAAKTAPDYFVTTDYEYK